MVCCLSDIAADVLRQVVASLIVSFLLKHQNPCTLIVSGIPTGSSAPTRVSTFQASFTQPSLTPLVAQFLRTERLREKSRVVKRSRKSNTAGRSQRRGEITRLNCYLATVNARCRASSDLI